MDAIKYVHEQLAKKIDFPKFRSGDAIAVSYRIIEGNKERIQIFKGNVIQIKGTGATKTFTVRKISSGVGVERIFPFTSPAIAEVEVLKGIGPGLAKPLKRLGLEKVVDILFHLPVNWVERHRVARLCPVQHDRLTENVARQQCTAHFRRICGNPPLVARIGLINPERVHGLLPKPVVRDVFVD